VYVGRVLQGRRDLKNARVAFAIGVALVTLYAASSLPPETPVAFRLRYVQLDPIPASPN